MEYVDEVLSACGGRSDDNLQLQRVKLDRIGWSLEGVVGVASGADERSSLWALYAADPGGDGAMQSPTTITGAMSFCILR